MMSNMTDNEITTALECCSVIEDNSDICDSKACKNCPYYYRGCHNTKNNMPKDAFNLINRQKAEIVKEKNKNSKLRNELNHLKTEIERLNNECRKTRRDLLNEIIRLEDQLETAKSETVKELAKRLKEHFEAQRGHISEHYGLRSYWEDKYFYDYEIEDEIDKFVKEMGDE